MVQGIMNRLTGFLFSDFHQHWFLKPQQKSRQAYLFESDVFIVMDVGEPLWVLDTTGDTLPPAALNHMEGTYCQGAG